MSDNLKDWLGINEQASAKSAEWCLLLWLIVKIYNNNEQDHNNVTQNMKINTVTK